MVPHHGIDAIGAPSLYEEATQEAERHKWIESQKHGFDLGDHAIHEWYRVHWARYCRHKRMEHVRGHQLWREFETEKFGRLYSLLVQGDLLVDRVLDRVYEGYENLEILNWAIQWGLEMNRVIEILSLVDVNRARLEPKPANQQD